MPHWVTVFTVAGAVVTLVGAFVSLSPGAVIAVADAVVSVSPGPVIAVPDAVVTVSPILVLLSIKFLFRYHKIIKNLLNSTSLNI